MDGGRGVVRRCSEKLKRRRMWEEMSVRPGIVGEWVEWDDCRDEGKKWSGIPYSYRTGRLKKEASGDHGSLMLP